MSKSKCPVWKKTSTKLAIVIGKLLHFLIKCLHLGTGATWPGHLALKIQPSLLRFLEDDLPQGSILISGTNGKTTTAHLISSILRGFGLTVVHNLSGANLVNGLVSALVTDCSWIGKRHSDIAVFEVDEKNLPLASASFDPEIVVLLNLSRDQLDRYAELELTLEKWRDTLVKLPPGVVVIYDKTDPLLRQLAEAGELRHLQWQPFGLRRLMGFSSPLPGRFNQKNTNAAVRVAHQLGVSDDQIRAALEGFLPVFGRGEELVAYGRTVKILLAKNPASFNENLKLLWSERSQVGTILFILNDKIADGRDVSWIWDVESSLLKQVCQQFPVLVSGRRGEDMALRLKYAVGQEDFNPPLSRNLRRMIRQSLARGDPEKVLYVLPTYTAMLEARQILLGRKIL